MDIQKGPNCFLKLLLMLWKNIRVLVGQICPMISIVVIFIVLPCFIMLFRLSKALQQPTPYVNPPPISKKLSAEGNNKYFYSPENKVLEELLKNASLDAKAFRNAKEMYSVLTKDDIEETKVGIEFSDSYSGITELPDAFSFSIRLPESNGKVSHKLFSLQSSDAYKTTFIKVQNSLSVAYIESKLSHMNKSLNFTGPDFKNFPDRTYKTDSKITYVFAVVVMCLAVLTIFMTIIIVKSIVEEKELQIKETLNLVGIGNCLQWLSWYVHFFILLLIASSIYTMCWTIPLPNNDFALLFFTNWSTFLVILIVFSHCLICFSFMISSFMSTSRRVTMNTILVLFLFYFPSRLIKEGLFIEVISSLNPISGIGLLVEGIKTTEIFGVGVQWDNIHQILNPQQSLSIASILLIMLLGSLISLIICLYMEYIRPGSYDISKPWYFPCTLCCRKATRKQLLPFMQIFYSCFSRSHPPPDVERPDDPELQLIAPSPEDKTPGVQIQQLSKTYGKNEALKGITFDLFKDEITVLLGHNGAGKTTLISMLACFTKPTSGTALVNGHDIRKNPRQAQRCIGLCPQHNVLFKNLSVASHIRLFSQLRGLRGKELKDEVAKYLGKLNFQAKIKTSAHKLSGGNQRRLSIACALCGGVKVVICDEPSTGLDPSSRRDVWKLIIESKKDCTILLTTHQMDDGEVLGDRIVIISDGQLRCIGTLSFLKKQVDASSLLTCETDRNCDVDKLTAFMAGYVSGIRPFSKMGRDVSYKLPQSSASSFPTLFRNLENQQKELGVRGFGLSAQSLEEIFMNYGAENFDSRMAGGAEQDKSDDDNGKKGNGKKGIDDYEDDHEYDNKASCGAQWRAMLVKKMLALCDYKIYHIILILLLIIIFLSTVISGIGAGGGTKQSLDVNAYKGYGISILFSEPKNPTKDARSAHDAINRLVGSGLELKRISEPMDKYLEKAYSSPEDQRKMVFVLCAVSLDSPLTGWVGANELVHAAPMTINLVYNVAVQQLFGEKVSLEVINEPYLEKPSNQDASTTGPIILLSIFLTLLAAPIINERKSHMKMQQEVSGLGMFTYWLSHLVFDMPVYLVYALLLLLLNYKFGPWHHILFVLLLIGLSGLCFVYLLICICHASILAIFLTLVLCIIIIPIMSVIAFLTLLFKPSLGEAIQGILYLHPFIAGSFALGKNFAYYSTCDTDSEDIIKLLGATCLNGYATSSRNCVCQHPITYPESWFLIITAILFFALLMFYEYGSFIWYKTKGCCTPNKPASIEDEKVFAESEKIKNMDQDVIGRRALVVKSLRKKYCCGPAAVNNISFAVRPRACLGLLGHNGAGKTTTFKMIVGEESIDGGEIWISGYSIKTQRNKAIKELGYCPQFDSFFEYFTGRQLLKFFLQLRGVKRGEIPDRIKQLGEKFAFTKHMDKKVKFYSGGTKRKINAAVGCMGKSLICLDEPSSGVDPASRRHVWNILSSLGEKGKAILLTSHSMDEINALCSKVVMLVDGNIHSIGSNQHVKNKSAKGLELKLVVKAIPEDVSRVLSEIEEQIIAAYPNAILHEKYEFSCRLTFLIPQTDASWADIFTLVDQKRNAWQLEDYTLQQPSLENVFVEIEEKKKKKPKS